jgi:hypothetical protein
MWFPHIIMIYWWPAKSNRIRVLKIWYFGHDGRTRLAQFSFLLHVTSRVSVVALSPSLKPEAWGLRPEAWGLKPEAWGLKPEAWSLIPKNQRILTASNQIVAATIWPDLWSMHMHSKESMNLDDLDSPQQSCVSHDLTWSLVKARAFQRINESWRLGSQQPIVSAAIWPGLWSKLARQGRNRRQRPRKEMQPRGAMRPPAEIHVCVFACMYA